jgi:hypothetical protein
MKHEPKKGKEERWGKGREGGGGGARKVEETMISIRVCPLVR